jgi:hypothetical protein
VCGGRGFDDREMLDTCLDFLLAFYKFDGLIQGGAKGADLMAKEWAEKNGIRCATFKADWMRHGKKAGIMRNQAMLDVGKPGLVVAFPGGRGTFDMIAKAKAQKIPVIEPIIREREFKLTCEEDQNENETLDRERSEC